MKKACILSIIIVTVFLLVSCPSAIEVKWNPDVRFATSIDFGKMMTEKIINSFGNGNSDGLDKLVCEDADPVALLFHKNLFEEDYEPEGREFEIEFDTPDFEEWDDLPDELKAELEDKYGQDLDIIGYYLSDRKYLFDGDQIIDLGEDDGDDFPEGFSFKTVISKLYVSGSDIINDLEIVFYIGERDVDKNDRIKVVMDRPAPAPSNFDIGWNLDGTHKWEKFKSFSDLPAGGENIDGLKDVVNGIVIEGKDITFEYEVFLKEGYYSKEFLEDDHIIKAELVLWIPLVFDAAPDAFLELDDFLGGGGKDLFGRKSPNEDSITEVIDSMIIKIKMNNRPFEGADFLVESGDPVNISIPMTLTNTTLNFPINEEDMEKINDPANYPFVPKFILFYPDGGTLTIPKNLKATTINFDAKIDYQVDLSGEEK